MLIFVELLLRKNFNMVIVMIIVVLKVVLMIPPTHSVIQNANNALGAKRAGANKTVTFVQLIFKRTDIDPDFDEFCKIQKN